MAKRGGGRRKQGIVSWITSVIALLIGLFPVWAQLKELLLGGKRIDQVASDLNRNYNPLSGDPAALRVGYGALVGGIVFKVATAELAKRARLRSMLPALRA